LPLLLLEVRKLLVNSIANDGKRYSKLDPSIILNENW
jgi:hypothetical protein